MCLSYMKCTSILLHKYKKKLFPSTFHISFKIYFHFLYILKNGWFEFGPKIILIINILIYSKYVLWIVAVYHVALVNHTFIKKYMRKVEINFMEKNCFPLSIPILQYFLYKFLLNVLSLSSLGLIEKLIGCKMDLIKIFKTLNCCINNKPFRHTRQRHLARSMLSKSTENRQYLCDNLSSHNS